MIRALVIALVLWLAGCGRQEPPAKPASPALWAIEDREGATRGWLFGTIHALPEGTRWETAALTGIIDEADVLVVEVRDLDPERTAAVFSRLARDEPGPPLAERLPSTARRDLFQALARADVDRDAFDDLETWAAALALARLGGETSAPISVDGSLIARFKGRPIAELEGVADQLAIFDRLPERDQRSLLTAVLAEQDDPAADAKALGKAWLTGDLAQLEQTTRRGMLADPALYGALSARRNMVWLGKIAPMLEKDRQPLVAVGAAHMLGPDGLPARLAAKGYRVRRIQ